MCGFVFYSGTDIEKKIFEKSLEKIAHRGPDDTEVELLSGAMIGFKRLAIMDLGHAGDQPFKKDGSYLVCNGEIYNYKKLKLEVSEHTFKSGSDCEVLLPIYKKFGAKKLVDCLDAEFALVIYDSDTGKTIAARDPIGIRPLFYGYSKESGKIAFASEIKALQLFCTGINPFPPGYLYVDGEFQQYHDPGHVDEYNFSTLEEVTKGIHDKLVDGVIKRLQSDAPIGFLLSGGLDSSLVCSIAQKHSKKPIRTFAIGMSEDAIDLKYAKQVADHIGSDHTEVIISKEDVLGAIREVVYHLESWDITTIRASIGMYLICKSIKEKTDIKVLLTGEVSDEIFGYKYTDFAPTADEFQKEAQKRVRELYMYDVLRADRCISAHSLEARVPFSDKDFVKFVMSIDPAKKMNSYGHGKFLLRKAFEHGDYLPDSILYREKAAFSDAVGHSMVDYIKAYAEQIFTDEDVERAASKYNYCTPFTKESLMYREIFTEMYPESEKHLVDYWMPNKSWANCDVKDPSARVLPNYGASGI